MLGEETILVKFSIPLLIVFRTLSATGWRLAREVDVRRTPSVMKQVARFDHAKPKTAHVTVENLVDSIRPQQDDEIDEEFQASFRPRMRAGLRDWRASKRKLGRVDIEAFEDAEPSLFAQVAAALCKAEVLKRKELFEAWEAASWIDAVFPDAARVADIAAGHGLLGWLLLVLALHRKQPRSAVCVDVHMPKSADAIRRCITQSWPELANSMHYVEGSVQHIQASQHVLLTSVHACGPLTDVVLERAVSGGAAVAVMPCCHSLRQPLPPEPGITAVLLARRASELGVAHAIDSARMEALRASGYIVEEAFCDPRVTSRNRLIMAKPAADVPDIVPTWPSAGSPDKRELSIQQGSFEIPLADIVTVAAMAAHNSSARAMDLVRKRGLIMQYDAVAGYRPPINQLSEGDAYRLIGDELVREGLVKNASGQFTIKVVMFFKDRTLLLHEAIATLKDLLVYPLLETLATKEGKRWVEDGSFAKIAKVVIEMHSNGDLDGSGSPGNLIQSIADAVGLQGKALFQPLRVCLTGRTAGPDIEGVLDVLHSIDDSVVCDYISLSERMEELASALEPLSESRSDIASQVL